MLRIAEGNYSGYRWQRRVYGLFQALAVRLELLKGGVGWMVAAVGILSMNILLNILDHTYISPHSSRHTESDPRVPSRGEPF